jgi:hypothetical protein
MATFVSSSNFIRGDGFLDIGKLDFIITKLAEGSNKVLYSVASTSSNMMTYEVYIKGKIKVYATLQEAVAAYNKGKLL